MRAKRKVIDIETLQIYESETAAANALGCSNVAVYRAINYSNQKRWTVKGRKLEYFEEWLFWDSREKEKYTRKNNIYFL